MYRKIYFLVIVILFSLSSKFIIAQTFSVKAGSGAGATFSDAIGVYIANGATNSSHPVYVKISGDNANPSYVFYAAGFWNIYSSIDNVNYWYYWTGTAPSTFPVGSSWSDAGGLKAGTSPPKTTQNTTAAITFTNNSSPALSPTVPTLPATNNEIGRFTLQGSRVGGVLQSVIIALSGTRSGMSNIRLWSGSIGGTQLGSDLSDAATITFSSFNSVVDSSAATQYYVTANLSSSATGGATASIPSQDSFTFTGANKPSSFSNALLSSSAVPLPIELSYFAVSANDNNIELSWTTATEINNYGFDIERSTTISPANWKKVGFVQGHGNSNSPKYYLFIDKSPLSGDLLYRLKQIDNNGSFQYYSPVQTKLNIEQYSLKQNFPNPFNPLTIISFTLPYKSNVKLAVYNLLGQIVADLVDQEKDAGVYNVEFNANNLASGVYFYKLNTGKFTAVKKLQVVK
jgi:hypothetical protein